MIFKHTNPYKRNLIILLCAEILLIICTKLYESYTVTGGAEDFSFGWTYGVPLLGGIVVAGYAFGIRCHQPLCRKRQVFRGWPMFDLQWPENYCYGCGAPMEGASIAREKHPPQPVKRILPVRIILRYYRDFIVIYLSAWTFFYSIIQDFDFSNYFPYLLESWAGTHRLWLSWASAGERALFIQSFSTFFAIMIFLGLIISDYFKRKSVEIKRRYVAIAYLGYVITCIAVLDVVGGLDRDYLFEELRASWVREGPTNSFLQGAALTLVALIVLGVATVQYVGGKRKD